MIGRVVGDRSSWKVGLLMVVTGMLGCGDEHPIGRVNVSAAVIDATHCPTIDGIAAAPGHVVVGGHISLKAVATASLRSDNLSYAWLPAAAIADATSVDSATYTCPAVGPQTITVKVTETTLGGACTVDQVVTVTCLAPTN
jgi:hypothetical protein